MNSDLNQKWSKFNEDRESKELSPIPFLEWFKKHYEKNPFSNSIKYLELDKEGPNRGTKNKQELMKRILTHIYNWGTGGYDEWISKLSIRLGLAPRTVKENYLNPLIKEGIIKQTDSQLYFVGPPEDVSEGSTGDR